MKNAFSKMGRADCRNGGGNLEPVILKAEHVGKEYMLGTVSGRTLRDAVKERLSGGKTRDEVNERLSGGKLQDAGRHNQRFIALSDVSFEIRRGETVGLIGPNGAGKSTLLKLISRITAPSRGRIFLNGRVSSMLEVGTGFHQELTGRENIYLNGSILGMSRREIDRKMESIIDFSECSAFIDTPVKRYSSGMYVKLAFAVASHLESEIMIMDEVLAVGDVKFQQKCLNKMKEVARKEGRTILYVSHNMDTIHQLCGRCMVLNQGKLVFDGEVEEAARIYLGKELRTETFLDLSRYLRPGWLGREDVRLLWAKYPESQPRLVQDVLSLHLRWHCNLPVEQMGLRVEIMDETRRPFATRVFYDIFSGEPGEEKEGGFQVDITSIMDGTYQTWYTLFCADPYGQSVDLDCVQGLDFTVKKEESQPLRWKNTSWGNVRL